MPLFECQFRSVDANEKSTRSIWNGLFIRTLLAFFSVSRSFLSIPNSYEQIRLLVVIIELWHYVNESNAITDAWKVASEDSFSVHMINWRVFEGGKSDGSTRTMCFAEREMCAHEQEMEHEHWTHELGPWASGFRFWERCGLSIPNQCTLHKLNATCMR